MNKKNTMASYKLDFKFTSKNRNGDSVEYSISDFQRSYGTWTWSEPSDDFALSKFDHDLIQRTHPDLFKPTNPEAYWNYPAKDMSAEDKMQIIKDDPVYAELDKSFNKWIQRRQGVVDTFTALYPNEQFNLFTLAKYVHKTKFLKALENNRPVKFKVGQLVTIANNVSGHLYDPFYWNKDLNKKPRIGIVSKWTDETSRRAGAGSRQLRIMWLASGEITQLPIRLLRAYEQPQENSEVTTST